MLFIHIKDYQVNSHFGLSNIKIKVKPKEIFALIGKSGSGKSTVAKIAIGVQACDNATIQLNEQELNTGLDRLIPQFKQVGYVPQNLHLKPHHTVAEYIAMLLQRETLSKQLTLTKYYVKLFNIQHLLSSKINQLSGGERQKIALIEAIAKPVGYLVLDEPFSQLDTEQKIEFSSIIRQLVTDLKIPCLLISHDVSDILKLSDQVGILNQGKLVFQGNWMKFSRSKNKYVIRLKDAFLSWKKTTDLIIDNLNIL